MFLQFSVKMYVLGTRGHTSNEYPKHTFCTRENFCDCLFAFLCINPLLKGVYPKRQEFAHRRIDPFSDGDKNNLIRSDVSISLKVSSHHENTLI